MAGELAHLSRLVEQDDDVRVVVLTGAGEAFCAGDEEDASGAAPPTLEQTAADLDSRRVASALGRISKPVVAAINGDALGHGLEIALACDIRLVAHGAQLGLPQVLEGGIPWDGGTQRLPRTVGRAWATDLLLTGRLVDSNEALRIGLVHRVVAADRLTEIANELASTIAGLAPIASRYAKESVLKGMDMTLEQGLRLEVDLNLLLQTTEDRAEGIASFLERRQPRYHGR